MDVITAKAACLGRPVMSAAQDALRKRLGLTLREWQIAYAWLTGEERSKPIAQQLGVTAKTVDIHVANIVRKLGVRSKLKAALLLDRALRAQARRTGLLKRRRMLRELAAIRRAA